MHYCAAMIRPTIYFLFILLLPIRLLAQWKPLGPYGGPIEILESNEKVTLASGPTGSFFRSTDGGKNWQITTQGLPNSPITAALVTDSLILVGTGGTGVYKSTNGGATWMASGRFDVTRTSGQPRAYGFLRVGQYLYAATAEGVFRSSNDGANWREVSNGLYTRDGIFSLVAIPGSRAILAGTGLGIYRSIDDGETWALVRSPITSASRNALEGNVFALEQGEGAIMAGSYGQGFFRSLDQGTTWTASNTGLPFGTSVYVIKVKNGVIYIGTDTGIYRSTNKGTTWAQMDNFPSDATISGLTFIGNSLLAATNSEGLFRTDNAGQSWTESNAGLLADTELLVTSGNKLWCVSGENVVRSLDGGKTWKIVRYKMTDDELIQDMKRDGNTLYLTNRDLYRSTDDGDTWQKVNQPLAIPDGVFLTSIWVSGNDILAATLNDGIYRSTDGGRVWRALSRDGLPTATNNRPTFISNVKNTLYVGYSAAGMFQSTNNGASWERVKGIRENADVWTLAAVGDTLYVGTNSESLYRSTDKGQTWTRADKGITSSTVRSILPTSAGIFVGTFKGAGLSTTKAAFWRRYNNGLPLLQASRENVAAEDLRMFPLAAENNQLYGSTLYGIWTRPMNEAPYITPEPVVSSTCVNGLIQVRYRISDTFEEKNQFTIQVSGPDGVYSTTLITPLAGCASPGQATDQGFFGCPIDLRMPTGTVASDNYRMRIVASSPATQSADIPIKLTPNPIPTKPVVKVDSSKLTTVDAAFAYQWLLNDRPIPGATSRTYDPKNFPGIYAVRVANECTGTAVSDQLAYLVTATEPTFDDEVSVFPNPADDALTVQLPRAVKGTRLRLLRPDGALLNEQTTATTQHRLSIGSLPAGLYLLQVKQGDRQTVKRVLKK
ncbi:hypothetical protein BN8_04086 [Fibrisoma limi BUZ 3]|uniref:Uncharacterized protein n=2 Tax=Fibrisoma limi TaxID=663275 RepID=I2GLU6_9BACT|nr:hypothetical protein BN8_04086 [Fibrisoma limi BUZ 3]